MPKRQAAYSEWVSTETVRRQAKRANDPNADEDGTRLYDAYKCIHGCDATILVTSYKGLGRAIDDHLRKCSNCPESAKPAAKCQRGSSGALRSVIKELDATRLELAAVRASRQALKAAAVALRAASQTTALKAVEAALAGQKKTKKKKRKKKKKARETLLE